MHSVLSKLNCAVSTVKMGAASFTIILLCIAGCLSYGVKWRNGMKKIIGGRTVTIQQAPYMVALRISEFFCGGSIISRSWVVTAAHCFDEVDDPIGITTVCSGSRYFQNCIVHTVDNVTIHEQYNEPLAYNNDVAVAHVTSPFNFNNGSQPIALPSPGESDAPWGTICGWGRYRRYPNGTAIAGLSKELRCARVPLVKNCPTYFEIGDITDKEVCYGYVRQGGVDTCQGDSGGPLTFRGILYGITSWGDGCAEAGKPGVFAKVTQFVGWIKTKTGIN